MKKNLLLFSLLLISVIADAQFEQNLSISFAPGIFKTFGKKSTSEGPLQMPNYKMGFSANGGLQFKINNRLSLAAEFGLIVSKRWLYKEGEKFNDLSWVIEDTITGLPITSGEDYLDIFNYSMGIRLKYYILPAKKIDPYIFAGANVNWTRSYFDNAEWVAYKNLGWPGFDETTPPNDNLEQNFGIGFNPGAGLEYSPSDRIHFYLESYYYFINLNKDNFKIPSQKENFKAFVLQAGLRLNFIKSKDL